MVGKMIVGVAPQDSWKKIFGLMRSEFQELSDQLRPAIAPMPYSPNHGALSTERKLAINL